jgi:hypothetical protein
VQVRNFVAVQERHPRGRIVLVGSSSVFLLVRRVLGLLKLDPNSDDGEIAVLRHQLAGLQRQVPRPRHSPTVRALLASLAKLQPPRSPSTRRRALTAR